MFLDVTPVFLNPNKSYPFEISVPLEKQLVSGDELTFDDVALSGSYTMLDDVITLKGTLSTQAHTQCDLCLKPVTFPVEMEFEEIFRKDADEDEDGCFRYENKRLPLDHMVLTLVMLQLPLRFLCSENCGGAAAELKEWDEQNTVWAEDGTEEEASYRPFEGLAGLMESLQKEEDLEKK